MGDYVQIPGANAKVAIKDSEGDEVDVEERSGQFTAEVHDAVAYDVITSILDELKEIKELLQFTLGG